MKKQNNRFRNGNNNNNNGYTLNYKFDSVSIAGKISGTALDLIRRYNDLAKEAQSSGNYVEMEVYRQYAEHYRKIVTDINERRNARAENPNKPEETMPAEATAAEKSEPTEITPAANGYVETLPATEAVKSFTVVEIDDSKDKKESSKEKTSAEDKPKRVVRRRATTSRKTTEEKSVAEA